MAEAVRTEIGAISLQSVDDTSASWSLKGLLRRIQPAGSLARFEKRVSDNHHHLICRACGRTEDVDCAVGFAPCLTAADGQGFVIDEAEVRLLRYSAMVQGAGCKVPCTLNRR